MKCRPLRGPGRREIGHGALAERALARMMPDAGSVPVHDPHRLRDARVERLARRWPRCAAAACRSWTRAFRSSRRSPASRWASSRRATQVRRSSPTSSATRITSATWTSRSAAPRRGITAIQMDIKIAGPHARRSCSRRSTRRAKAASTSSARCSRRCPSRAPSSAKYAPRITTIKVKPDQIRLIIGPGGKTIKGIVDQTGVAIDVEDDGTVNVASTRSARR